MQQVCIYHFLRRALGQRVAVTKVVDLDISDVVAVLLIHLVVQTVARTCRWRLRGAPIRRALGGADRGNIDVLYALLSLNLCIDLSGGGGGGGGGSSWVSLRWALRVASDRATAASTVGPVAGCRRARAAVEARALGLSLGLVKARALARFVGHVVYVCDGFPVEVAEVLYSVTRFLVPSRGR